MASPAFSIRAALKTAKPYLFPWLGMASATHAGQLARLDFDAVTIDLQHGMIDNGDAVAMVAAIVAAGKPAIIRVRWNDPGLIGFALDMGASAVIVPMTNSRADVEAAVKAAKYPPVGMRSWGGYQMVQAAGVSAGEYLQQANSQTLLFAMIETQEALDALDDIATVPGLDGLFVGPSDLSIALSKGKGIDKTSPATLAAMAKVSAACKKHNLVAGAFAGSNDVVKTYMELGFQFFAATTDGDILRQGAKAALAELR